MIATLTVNPSLDRTVDLAAPLLRGGVQRARIVTEQPGGKGVNVTRVVTASAGESVAVLPADDSDPLLETMRRSGLRVATLPIDRPVRSNVTLAEPDGTTTKINVPGPELTTAQLTELVELLLAHAEPARWIVLAGSLPPGAPDDYYRRIIRLARERFGDKSPKIAVDTSGSPLAEVLSGGRGAAPDLIKPNAHELAELTSPGGLPDPSRAAEFEAGPDLAVEAARELLGTGVGAVLATLGSEGAILVDRGGAWLARQVPVTARSTVGAGDSALAGYLLAESRGTAPGDCLRHAVAFGAAAVSLPGTELPSLEHIRVDTADCQRLADTEFSHAHGGSK